MGGFLLLGGEEVRCGVQGGEAVHLIPHLPMQAALPRDGVGGDPLIIHPNHKGAVSRLARREGRHAVGDGREGPEVRQAAAHTADLVGKLGVVEPVQPGEGLPVAVSVDALGVGVEEFVVAAPPAVRVLLRRQVHMLLAPLQGLHLAEVVVALGSAYHAALPEGKGVEDCVQTVRAVAADEEVRARDGLVPQPAVAYILQRGGGDDVARHRIGGVARVVLRDVGDERDDPPGLGELAAEADLLHPVEVVAEQLHDPGAFAAGRCGL